MNATLRTDEHGQFWECGFCLTAHDRPAAAQTCCSRLVMPDIDMSFGRREKPLTPAQIAERMRPRLTPVDEWLTRRTRYAR